MPRKKLFDLRVKRVEDGVCLYFGKGTPAYMNDRNDRSPFTIRIYRGEQPDFVFGRDYMEFFDGLRAEDAELIFEGPIQAVDAKMYTYTDTTVKVGSTYVYWVSAGPDDLPTGPVPVRVRDWNIWWPIGKVEQYMERLTKAYPRQVVMKTVGHTVRGRQIQALYAGNMNRCIACVGLVHAGESGPELILPALERLLERHGGLFEAAGIAILPSVNIDMRELEVEGNPTYLRTNCNGVDINRNFPAHWDIVENTYGQDTTNPHVTTYRGERPCSEPETRALMAFLQDISPRAVFSFHALSGICGDAFATTRFAKEDKAFHDTCMQWIEAYSSGFSLNESYKIIFHYVCTAGSLPSWMYLNGGIPAFDLEWDERERSKLGLFDTTSIELLEEYQERHYRGLRNVMELLQVAG